jgi:hypothetical protein
VLFASLALLGTVFSPAGHAAESCPGGRDVVRTNGTILTVDAADRTVNTVRIRGKRFLVRACESEADRRPGRSAG